MRILTDLGRAPNLLSLSRIALIYLSAGLMLAGCPLLAVAAGLVAGITDYLDGWLARRLGLATELGAILDRLCDLVFESTWLVVALVLQDVSPIVLFVYLFRELVVVSARLYSAAHGVRVASTFAGKLKSNFLGYAAFFVYLSHAAFFAPARDLFRFVGYVGLYGGLALSYWSACDYLRRFALAYDLDHSGP